MHRHSRLLTRSSSVLKVDQVRSLSVLLPPGEVLVQPEDLLSVPASLLRVVGGGVPYLQQPVGQDAGPLLGIGAHLSPALQGVGRVDGEPGGAPAVHLHFRGEDGSYCVDPLNHLFVRVRHEAVGHLASTDRKLVTTFKCCRQTLLSLVMSSNE